MDTHRYRALYLASFSEFGFAPAHGSIAHDTFLTLAGAPEVTPQLAPKQR